MKTQFRKRALVALVLGIFLLPAAAGTAAQYMKRFALIVGANNGGSDRVRLRYALSDASGVVSVLRQLGGISGADIRFLKQPSRDGLAHELNLIRNRLRRARSRYGRTELLFYYSGHSDSRGLLLNGRCFGYRRLRDMIRAIEADIRITILDSCASGELTRLKGGRMRSPFLVDTSMKMKGTVFLTSSSHNEASQESDAIRGSFFTHYLLSGLRGAADSSRDGRVTLNEAYQFAYHQTLARTEKTMGGPQHPGKAIQMSGSGEVVLTDIRKSSARLRLNDDLSGRIFIRSQEGVFVAELNKTAGVPVTFGLGTGRYLVTLERKNRVYSSTVDLDRGATFRLSRRQFVASGRTRARGKGEDKKTARPPIIPSFINLGITPSLSLGGDDQLKREHNFAFSLAVGYSDRVVGTAISLGIYTVGETMTGSIISGGANFLKGKGKGMAFAGGANLGHADFMGLMASGGINTARNFWGVQFSSVNVANHLHGAQFAVANIANQVAGGQFGAANLCLSGHVMGTQIGAYNQSRNVSGFQVGAVNLGDQVDGVQIGAVNIAQGKAAVQIGLVNIADETSVPIGLVNVIRNGTFRLSFWYDETGFLNAGIKLGSRSFYTLYVAGRRTSDDLLSTGFGFGGWIETSTRFYLQLDLLSQFFVSTTSWAYTMPEQHVESLHRVRLGLGFRLAANVSVAGGASFNLHHPGESTVAPLGGTAYGSGRVRYWPGFFFGVQLF